MVAALLGKARGSDWVMVLSLLARSRGWEWSEGRGSVWELSFRLGTYFGDSKNGTEDEGMRRYDGGGGALWQDEMEAKLGGLFREKEI